MNKKPEEDIEANKVKSNQLAAMFSHIFLDRLHTRLSEHLADDVDAGGYDRDSDSPYWRDSDLV